MPASIKSPLQWYREDLVPPTLFRPCAHKMLSRGRSSDRGRQRAIKEVVIEGDRGQ